MIFVISHAQPIQAVVGSFFNLFCEHTGSNGLSFSTAVMTTYFSRLPTRDTNSAYAAYIC